jgi:hypothetical protein
MTKEWFNNLQLDVIPGPLIEPPVPVSKPPAPQPHAPGWGGIRKDAARKMQKARGEK